MPSFTKDLRNGVRLLFTNPGFTLVAVLTLALGIGATSAIFSIVDAVLLRPLPFPQPEQLVRLYETKDGERRGFSCPGFFDVKAQSKTIQDLLPFIRWNFNISGDGSPERTWGAAVSHNAFKSLGADPILGRGFSKEEDSAGGNAYVTVISHDLWRRRFNSDPKAIGKTMKLEGDTYEVIGVAPPGFDFPDGAALWTPMALTPDLAPRAMTILPVVARLKPNASVEQVQRELSTIASRLEQQYPDSNEGVGIEVVELRDQIVEKARPALLVLLGVTAMVLLIACANVAHLLLARASARESEIALRTALGAGRGRLARQLLAESVVLALAGGAVGLLLAYWGNRILVTLGQEEIPRLEGAGIDLRVLLFTLGVSLLSGIVFGMVPALRSSRPDLTLTLKEGGRAQTGSRGRRIRRVLVFAEVAVAMVLVVGAGLLIKSFSRLTGIEPGFNPGNALSMEFTLFYSKYTTQAQTSQAFNRIIERVEALPGVKAAGTTFALPFSSRRAFGDFTIEGRPESEKVRGSFQVVTPRFFAAIGVPLVKGRLFTAEDDGDSPPVLLINQELARVHFPGEDPIGKKINVGADFGPAGKADPASREIVGVVGSVRQAGLDQEVPQEMYIPNAQTTWRMGSLVVRTEGDPAPYAPTIQKQIWAIDPDLSVTNVYTLEERLANSVSRSRFSTRLVTLFAVLALVLAAIGVYGVLSYSITQQTQEIGIRLALGASRRNVLMSVVGEGLVLGLIGVAFGVALSVGLTRAAEGVLSRLLFEVKATDVTTFLTVALTLLAVVFLASYLPARRAMRVDPANTLRAV